MEEGGAAGGIFRPCAGHLFPGSFFFLEIKELILPLAVMFQENGRTKKNDQQLRDAIIHEQPGQSDQTYPDQSPRFSHSLKLSGGEDADAVHSLSLSLSLTLEVST